MRHHEQDLAIRTSAARPRNARATSFLNGIVGAMAPTDAHIAVCCDAGLELGVEQLGPLGGIVREALSNAMRHAYPEGSPGKIWIRLVDENGRMKLTVRDQGVGFPEPRPGGLGLPRMAVFAHELGGFLRCDNRPFSGAEVMVVFPRRTPSPA